MTKAKGTLLGLVLVVFGLLLAVLASSAGQRAFQHVKYGNPMKFCVADIGVTLRQDWQIALLRQKDNEWPLVVGLIPAPMSIDKEGGSLAQVSLRSDKHNGQVSIHRTREVSASAEVLSSCRSSQFCEVTVSRFDARSAVVEVSSSGTIWIQYLDKPIMIGLHGAVKDDLGDIALGACDQK